MPTDHYLVVAKMMMKVKGIKPTRKDIASLKKLDIQEPYDIGLSNRFIVVALSEAIGDLQYEIGLRMR